MEEVGNAGGTRNMIGKKRGLLHDTPTCSTRIHFRFEGRSGWHKRTAKTENTGRFCLPRKLKFGKSTPQRNIYDVQQDASRKQKAVLSQKSNDVRHEEHGLHLLDCPCDDESKSNKQRRLTSSRFLSKSQALF